MYCTYDPLHPPISYANVFIEDDLCWQTEVLFVSAIQRCHIYIFQLVAV